jgi:multiple sugar transport system permease protein
VELGWIDSYRALIIPGILGGVYGTFLIRQFFLTIPQELEDAAVIDGTSPWWNHRRSRRRLTMNTVWKH